MGSFRNLLKNYWPQRHKTFWVFSRKCSTQISKSKNKGAEFFFTYFSLRMLSMSRIFSTPPFSDSDIWVENFLENTQKFYDGGAWAWKAKICMGLFWHRRKGSLFKSWPLGFGRGNISCFQHPMVTAPKFLPQ